MLTGYALVSANDPLEDTWCPFNAAQQHISTVETFPRTGSKSNHQLFHRVTGAEVAVRCEWPRVSHAETSLSLSQIAADVSRIRTLCPTLQEFRANGKGLHGGPPGGRLSRVDPKGAGKRKPWTREQRILHNKKATLKFEGECVMEPQHCSNRRSNKCKITSPCGPSRLPAHLLPYRVLGLFNHINDD